MKKIILTLLALINLLWVEGANAAALEAATGEGEYWYETITSHQKVSIPLLYRGDAVAFCRKIGALMGREEPRNPFELYIEATVFGRCLGLFNEDTVRRYGIESLANLISASEIDGEKACLVAGLGLHVDEVRLRLSPVVTSLDDKRGEFGLRFLPALYELREEHNLLAYYVLGFFRFEWGVSSGSLALKTEGEYLINQTAYGYCLPAVDIIRKISDERGIDAAPMLWRKRVLDDVFKKPNDGGYLVELAIEDDIYPWPHKTTKSSSPLPSCEGEFLGHYFRNKFLTNVLRTLPEDQKDSYERMNRILRPVLK